MTTSDTKPVTRLYLESNMQSVEIVGLSGGTVAALCRSCPGYSSPNDDSAAIVQTSSGDIVLVVADGVGGCPAGHKASAHAVQTVAKSVQAAQPNSDLRPAILDAIELANQEILDWAIGSATTLAVVEIHDRSARSYQVGDSMMLIVGQRGALKWKSTPHSPVGYAIESGMLNEAEAMQHDDRHVVSNLVGSDKMHIEIGPTRPLAARDTIVVASDGLFDNVHLDEVIERSRRGKLEKRMVDLDELSTQRMIQDVDHQPGKPDDLTILLFTL